MRPWLPPPERNTTLSGIGGSNTPQHITWKLCQQNPSTLPHSNLAKTGGKSICAAASTSLSWYHTSSGFPSPSSSPLIKTLLAGARRKLAAPVRRMEPLTLGMIKNLVSLPRNSLSDWQFAFYCVIAFFGLFRYNDLCNLYVSSFSFNDGNLIVELPNSKTDQFRAGSTIYIAANTADGSICPVAVAKAYFVQLKIAGFSDAAHVLSAPSSPGKLTPHGVLLKHLRVALAGTVSDPTRYGLHSFRSGGATAAANAKVSKELIATHGRWQSECVNRYIKQSVDSRYGVSQAMAK